MYRRLYLQLGDRVIHHRYPEWGVGQVVEEWASSLSGGLCMVRILFRDGEERSFINDLDDYNCGYYAGLRLHEEAPSPSFRTAPPARRRLTR